MPRRLPLVDWDTLINKPPLVLRNLTKIAAFALTSADAYAEDVASGRRSVDSLNLPGALLQLGPEVPFSAELLPEFRAWIMGNAFRDAVELILKHLDDIRDILAICSLPLPPDPTGGEWQTQVVDEGATFHKWFLNRKLEHLQKMYDFRLPSEALADFVTVTYARNCLVHRDGIVFDEDKNGPDGLHVRWRAPKASVSNPDTAATITTAPGARLELGGSLQIERYALHETVFAVGSRVGFSTQELSEIGAFLSSFTRDLSAQTLRWAQKKTGVLRSG